MSKNEILNLVVCDHLLFGFFYGATVLIISGSALVTFLELQDIQFKDFSSTLSDIGTDTRILTLLITLKIILLSLGLFLERGIKITIMSFQIHLSFL